MLRRLWMLLFVAYLGFVLWVTLHPLPGEEHGPLLFPFLDTWRQMRDLGDKTALREVTGNVALFVPFGFLLPAWWRAARRFWPIVAAGFALSLAVELSQWLFVAGRSPSIDDIIFNTVGTGVGGAVFLLLRGARRHRRDRARGHELHAEARG